MKDPHHLSAPRNNVLPTLLLIEKMIIRFCAIIRKAIYSTDDLELHQLICTSYDT